MADLLKVAKELIGVAGVIRSKWIVDENIPIFKDDGRNYIEGLL